MISISFHESCYPGPKAEKIILRKGQVFYIERCKISIRGIEGDLDKWRSVSYLWIIYAILLEVNSPIIDL